MEAKSKEMDRRTFMKTTLVAGAGFALSASMKERAWGASSVEGELADLSLSELSRLIREGKITSKEIVTTYLKRIQELDGPKGLNSYITVASDEAMEAADHLDKLAKQGKFKGLLHGLPIAVKDNLDTQGIRTTGGSKILSSWVPPEESTVVRKLKEAGAIIIGKTNMHEFAFGITTNNPHYGPTRNPYDSSRIPGGSSGGSGAAVAAALCAGAIGTDTGGSVRIPAALCGNPSVGSIW